MAENGDVTNFTPTAKTDATWAIFFPPSLVLYSPTRKSTGTPTRDLGFGREVAFCLGSALLGNFAPVFAALTAYGEVPWPERPQGEASRGARLLHRDRAAEGRRPDDYVWWWW